MLGRLDALLSVGEALGPVVAGLLWNCRRAAAAFGVRAKLGIVTELVFGRRLRAPGKRPERA